MRGGPRRPWRPRRPQSKRWFRKPKIETYDSKKVEARAALFQDLTMDKVWSAYFFRQTERYIGKRFKALFTGKKGKSDFGWEGFKINIAKDKVFDIGGLNSLQSVEESNLYDILMYATIEKMKADEYNRMLEKK